MKYAYEDLSYDQFEKLVVFLCQKLLGIAVQGFAAGADGGRDAKFHGMAELFPSQVGPWNGKTVIQAKHTNGYNRNFSEFDFYSPNNKNTIIGKEIPRIKKLKAGGHLDHYMLFANRSLSGNAESLIRTHIANECGLSEESVYLCGVEQLEVWLKQFPNVAILANLDPIDSPLIVSPDDFSEIVQAFARHKDFVLKEIDNPPTPRMTYKDKNTRNNMSEEYAEASQKMFLKETESIGKFLASPENRDLLQMYESVVEEFQIKIIAKRKDYQTFDDVMNYLSDLLINRDPILRQQKHKRLTRAILFYMYWICDIGM